MVPRPLAAIWRDLARPGRRRPHRLAVARFARAPGHGSPRRSRPGPGRTAAAADHDAACDQSRRRGLLPRRGQRQGRLGPPGADRALRSGDLPGGRGAPGGRRRDLVGGRRRGDLPRPGGACPVSSILSLMAQAPTATAAEIIRRAHHIAVRDLRACYDPHGIVAGRLHFNAYWTRDGCWASWGALALGGGDQVKALLEIFNPVQIPSGELAGRVEFLGHTFGPYHTRRMQDRKSVV